MTQYKKLEDRILKMEETLRDTISMQMLVYSKQYPELTKPDTTASGPRRETENEVEKALDPNQTELNLDNKKS